MGSGSKFSVQFSKGFGIGLYIDTFPHTLSINISLICIHFYFGFGKGYDE